MKLGEFIDKFSHNNLIRLHYKSDVGYITVLDNFNDVSMDWEVNKNKGTYSKYREHEVLGLASICGGQYPEAINIVIERIPLEELREKKLKELGI